MDDSNRKLWTIVIICITILLFSISGCAIHKNEKIKEVIIAGISPVQAKYAFTMAAGTVEIAALLTEKK